MVLGALLVALIILFFTTGEVTAGTYVPVGLLALAMIIGINLVFGFKRHKLTFVLKDRKLRWQSKAGDFKYKVASVNQVIAFARDLGLLKSEVFVSYECSRHALDDARRRSRCRLPRAIRGSDDRGSGQRPSLWSWRWRPFRRS